MWAQTLLAGFFVHLITSSFTAGDWCWHLSLLGMIPKKVGAHLSPSSWSPLRLRCSSSANLYGEDGLGTPRGPTFLMSSWLINTVCSPSLGQAAWFGNPSPSSILGAVWPGRAALSLAWFLYIFGHPKGPHTSVSSQSEGDWNCTEFKSKICYYTNLTKCTFIVLCIGFKQSYSYNHIHWQLKVYIWKSN